MKDTLIELWEVVLKTIWIGVFIVIGLGLMRLMAWSDTDMHGDGSKVERSLMPPL